MRPCAPGWLCLPRAGFPQAFSPTNQPASSRSQGGSYASTQPTARPLIHGDFRRAQSQPQDERAEAASNAGGFHVFSFVSSSAS